MKTQKMIRKLIRAFLCLTVLFAMHSLSVQAAQSGKISTWRQVKNLTFSKDVTGDGKRDTVKVKMTRSKGTSGFTISVNGKQALSKLALYFNDLTVQYLYMAKNKEFIQIIANGDSSTNVLNEIYRYDKKTRKLVRVLELPSEKKSFACYDGRVVSVSGSEIKVQQSYQPPETGWIDWKFTYTYKNGKFKLKSNTAAVKSSYLAKKNSFRVANSVSFYTSTNLKKKAFTAKRNDVLTLTKIKVSGGKAYLQFKKNGKTGWQKVGNYSNYFYQNRHWFYGINLAS